MKILGQPSSLFRLDNIHRISQWEATPNLIQEQAIIFKVPSKLSLKLVILLYKCKNTCDKFSANTIGFSIKNICFPQILFHTLYIEKGEYISKNEIAFTLQKFKPRITYIYTRNNN